MEPNPVLKKLGFSPQDRLVIIHTDDIGMCQASVDAYRDLLDFGLISSAATMVPCSWFPSAADLCRGNPRADMGVHLTLNCEWRSYRWRPVSTADPASGLLDELGYLPMTREAVHEHAQPEAVLAELRLQVRLAQQAGIDLTHVDTHMGTVAHPKFVASYIQVALENKLPAMILRLDEQGYRRLGMDASGAAMAVSVVQQLEAMGMPLLDHIIGLPLDQPLNRMALAKQVLSGLEPGVTHFIIHPSKDTTELRAITPDWQSRYGDYSVFTSEEMRRFIQQSGLQVIGYRQLKTLMPS